MIGNTILHYRILEQIGQGGMGVVYKAEDTKLKRTVAIKCMPRQIAASDEARALQDRGPGCGGVESSQRRYDLCYRRA